MNWLNFIPWQMYFFNPTWEDNFPTTNLEALACGIPVITYNTGGSIEAIDDYTGVIVEQGNIEESLVAIRQMKCMGKSFYSEKCRKRVVDYFEKKERYSEYLQLYKNILSKK